MPWSREPHSSTKKLSTEFQQRQDSSSNLRVTFRILAGKLGPKIFQGINEEIWELRLR